jgi:hypothetical protein
MGAASQTPTHYWIVNAVAEMGIDDPQPDTVNVH